MVESGEINGRQGRKNMYQVASARSHVAGGKGLDSV